jgi:hypothetical protein
MYKLAMFTYQLITYRGWFLVNHLAVHINTGRWNYSYTASVTMWKISIRICTFSASNTDTDSNGLWESALTSTEMWWASPSNGSVKLSAHCKLSPPTNESDKMGTSILTNVFAVFTIKFSEVTQLSQSAWALNF